MLSQQNRLKQADEIASVFRRGKGFHSPFFSVKYAPREEGSDTRVAFSLGKKYLPKAIQRNRLKRRIIGELKTHPEIFVLGLDMVFFLTRQPELGQKQLVRESVENFLKKVYPVK